MFLLRIFRGCFNKRLLPLSHARYRQEVEDALIAKGYGRGYYTPTYVHEHHSGNVMVDIIKVGIEQELVGYAELTTEGKVIELVL